MTQTGTDVLLRGVGAYRGRTPRAALIANHC